MVRPQAISGTNTAERRWRAAQRAGLDRVPALVRTLDDQSALALALIENVQREDLSPLEEAAALERLMTTFSLTQSQAAEAVGKQRATVANLLRLLRLGSEARRLLERGDLTMGHARALLALDDPRQGTLAREAVQRGWTVREMERQVQRALAPSKEGAGSEATGPSRETRHLERSLSERLGAPGVNTGRGGIVIRRFLDELEACCPPPVMLPRALVALPRPGCIIRRFSLRRKTSVAGEGQRGRRCGRRR